MYFVTDSAAKGLGNRTQIFVMVDKLSMSKSWFGRLLRLRSRDWVGAITSRA